MTALRRTPLISSPAPTLIVPPSVSPATAATGTWPAANRAVFARFHLPAAATLRYVCWVCTVQSGNVQYGVVRLSGVGMLSYERVMHSGVIACPAAGDIRGDCGATLLPPGTYAAFLWCDNVTVQTRTGTSTGLSALRIAGHVSSLTGGVPTSGSLQWLTNYVGLTVEGDT